MLHFVLIIFPKYACNNKDTMACTITERKRLQDQCALEDPNRKCKKMDSIYMFEEFDVSVIMDDNQNVWFKGIDLARALEMKDPRSSIQKMVEKTDCESYENLSHSIPKYRHIPGLRPETIFVNESGMKSFISQSKKTKSESFKKWIYDVVLPSIRKTNEYEVDPVENPYREMIEMLKKQIEELQVRNANLEHKITNFENENSSLKNENSSLVIKNSNLENKNSNLEKKKANLENKKANLEKKNSNLENENSSLKNEKSSLAIKNLNLEKKNSNLENKKANLEHKISNFEKENSSLKSENSSLVIKNSNLENRNSDLENRNKSLYDDARKYLQQLFEIKPSCVPPLENIGKQEYFVIYRKYRLDSIPLYDSMPYYACRIQLDSLEQRYHELLVHYPQLEKILQLSVPNSVTFFNYVLEQMPKFIERETRGQSFCIHNISEDQMLTMIKNIYRTTHGELTLGKV